MTNNLKKILQGSPATGFKLKKIQIDTHQEPIVYLNQNNPVCRSEGFSAMSRVRVITQHNSIIATVNVITNSFLKENEIGLSEYAWRLIGGQEGEDVSIAHTRPVESFSVVRGKLFGKSIDQTQMHQIISDIVGGRYTQIQLAAFILACLEDHLSLEEMCFLTQAMVDTGDRLQWGDKIVMDKHCVGGLPGNRTTPLVVSIVTACGLTMPKTSSRAITSPAGTADTLEVITTVDLSLEQMKKVVESQGGCFAWGGTVNFSPSDDKLIQIERALELDSEGQMVPSILSKKIAAGATHVVIDIPVGPTAKVRSQAFAQALQEKLVAVGKCMGLTVLPVITDGSQPVGRGVGPLWEMLDIIEVFNNQPHQPYDLRERATTLAGHILEMGKVCEPNQGKALAETLLRDGQAWDKFQAICRAQGGIKDLPKPKFKHEILAPQRGVICHFNNRFVARLAKLAGAPTDPAAGIQFDVKLGDLVEKGQRLFTVYSENKGELCYALDFLAGHPNEILIEAEQI